MARVAAPVLAASAVNSTVPIAAKPNFDCQRRSGAAELSAVAEASRVPLERATGSYSAANRTALLEGMPLAGVLIAASSRPSHRPCSPSGAGWNDPHESAPFQQDRERAGEAASSRLS